jgi:hypothetical protein
LRKARTSHDFTDTSGAEDGHRQRRQHRALKEWIVKRRGIAFDFQEISPVSRAFRADASAQLIKI